MKTLSLLIFVGVISFSSDPDAKRLDEFLKKLDLFYERVKSSSDRWAMPNFPARSNDTAMPMPEIRFLDDETGLEYSAHKRKIYSPDLEVGLDVNTGIVYDFKKRKQYRLDDLRRERQGKKG